MQQYFIYFLLWRLHEKEWSTDFLQLTKNKENAGGVVIHEANNVTKFGRKHHNLHQQWASEYLQDIPLVEGNNCIFNHISYGWSNL